MNAVFSHGEIQMSDASIGYGSFFHISRDNGATWLQIAEVFDITPPSDTVDQVDVTHMQSPDRRREFVPGLSDPGSAGFEMNFVPGSASDLLIQEIRAAGEQVVCRITFPNAVEWKFTGQVESYEPAVPTEDKMTATVSFKVSGSTVVSPASAPANSVIPAISGIATEGETLTAWEGRWTAAAAYTYQWLRDGAPISGAVSSTYSVVAADVGEVISVTVTATNSAGSASASSAATSTVTGA